MSKGIESKRMVGEWDFCDSDNEYETRNVLFEKEMEEFQKKEGERIHWNDQLLKLKLFVKSYSIFFSILLFLLILVICYFVIWIIYRQKYT